MSNEQSKISDERFHELYTQAKDALVEKNYIQAETIFKAALELGRQLHPAPCLDTTACLIGLGDVYFGSSMFEPARDFYKKALSEHDKTEKSERKDKISPMFKYCKALTVLEEYQDADRAYADTVQVAELLLPVGNPLLTNIYDSYANMIAQSQMDPGPEREKFFREKAEASRRKYVPPVRPKQNPTRTDLPKLRAAAKPSAPIFETIGSKTAVQTQTGLVVRNVQIVMALITVACIAYGVLNSGTRNYFVGLFNHKTHETSTNGTR
ncbi:MAG TPA: tetratricopeptide repeat protein [Drouetiella sp.]